MKLKMLKDSDLLKLVMEMTLAVGMVTASPVPESAIGGVVNFFTIHHTTLTLSRVSPSPIVATAPMSLFPTKKHRSSKIEIFGPDGLPMAKNL